MMGEIAPAIQQHKGLIDEQRSGQERQKLLQGTISDLVEILLCPRPQVLKDLAFKIYSESNQTPMNSGALIQQLQDNASLKISSYLVMLLILR